MKLTAYGLQDRDGWKKAGYLLPEFDIPAALAHTRTAPQWIHFGAGNIFRAFQANLAQKLLEQGLMESGLIAVEGYDAQIIDRMYLPHDNLSILATLKADGTVDKTVIGSITEALVLDRERRDDFMRLKEIFRSPTLQLASFTITEKGYALTNAHKDLLPDITADYAQGPASPQSYLGKVTSLIYERYLAGALPISLVSMDNCSHNGDKLYAAVDLSLIHS